MKTITYDETKFRLVPVEPTEKMIVELMCTGLRHAEYAEGRSPTVKEMAQGYGFMLAAAPQPELQSPDWPAINKVVEEYVDEYEWRGDGGDYTPTDFEQALISDAIYGLLELLPLAGKPAQQSATACQWRKLAHQFDAQRMLFRDLLRALVNGVRYEPAIALPEHDDLRALIEQADDALKSPPPAQQPAVPEALDLWTNNGDQRPDFDYRRGWNACRDALLSAQPPVSGADGLPIELRGISETAAEGRGVWRSCSGCHELNEGHDTGPRSKVFCCALGVGCSECGGIGAVWDTTDYGAMGDALAASMAQPQSSGNAGELPDEREMFNAANLRDAFGVAPTYREREMMFTAWQARAALAAQAADGEGQE